MPITVSGLNASLAAPGAPASPQTVRPFSGIQLTDSAAGTAYDWTVSVPASDGSLSFSNAEGLFETLFNYDGVSQDFTSFSFNGTAAQMTAFLNSDLTLTALRANSGTFPVSLSVDTPGASFAGQAGGSLLSTSVVVGSVPIVVPGLLPFAALAVQSSDPAATPTVSATVVPSVPGVYSNLGGGVLDPTGLILTSAQTAALDTASLNHATFGLTQAGLSLGGVSVTINGGGSATYTLLDGGTGVDTLTAGSGNDTLVAYGSRATLVSGPTPNLLYPVGANDTVIAGTGASTLVGGSTGTTFLLNNGNQLVFDGGGSAVINGGSGANTIVALTGSDTITLGAGANLVALQQGNNLAVATGVSTLLGGSGSDTIRSFGNALVFGRSGSMSFSNGSGTATVIGASGFGHVTVDGGAGGGLFGGGLGGNNQLTAGSQTSTLYGGGSGDILQAKGSSADVLVAGAGNETLNGAGTTGPNTYYLGSGADLLNVGAGSSVVIAGAGQATVNLGAGNQLVAVTRGLGGGQVLLNNFTLGSDYVTLQNFGDNNAARSAAIAGASVSNGSVSFTLSDNTRITLAGVGSVGPLNNVFI